MKFVLFSALTLLFAVSAFPATFTVNSTADVVDAHPGDGVCETSSGNGVCTLRAAVQEAGASTAANQIVVPAGLYKLSATPLCSYRLVTNSNLLTENMSALCVTGNVTITGAGSDSTIIDAGGAAGATCCGSYPSARGMVIPVGSVVTLTGVTIQNGLSSGGYRFLGGAAINNQAKLNISQCVLTGNNGLPGGAGIWNDGVLVADNVNFSGNIAGGYGGGGIYNNVYGTAEVSNSTFNLNQGNGGGAIANSGPLRVLSSTFSNNTSTANGGAIDNGHALVVLTNVTIVSNQAFVGGALWNYSFGSMTVNNSTIALNHATYHTGGVSNGETFTISNSILGGNFDDGNPSAPTDCEGPITSQGHNLISSVTGTCKVTGLTSTDIYGLPPGVASLSFNGGTTQTLALLSTSKAIDAGDPSTPGTGGTSCAAADQRGSIRPQNGRCDIGAFERSATLSITGIAPTHAANTSIVEGVVFGGGMLGGASVKLQKLGQSDIAGAQIGVQDGNSSLAAEFDLTGKSPGTWDIVVTNPDGSNYRLPGAFQIDTGGSADVWARVGGTAFVRPGAMATYYVLFGNHGNVDALDVPVTLSVPTTVPLATNFTLAPPPAQSGQVATDWTQVPQYVTPGPASGWVNVPLLLPIVPAGFTGSLRFSVAVPGNLVHGDSFQLYASSGDPFLQVGQDPTALIAELTANAADYAQYGLGVTIPSSENAALNQYVATQLQNVLAAARAQFTATSGSIPLAYSLAQLNIDAAQFAAANATGASTPHAAFAKAVKPLVTSTNSAPTTLCTTPDGRVVSIKVGDVQPPGSSCKDPELYIPPPPCVEGLKSTDAHPCVPPDTSPLTPSQCRETKGHHVSNSGGLCLPNPGQGCAILPNPLLGLDPDCTIVPIKTSVDPNAKSGPFGPGAQQFHTSGTAYNYEVEFQNQPTAPVPAQQVIVTDSLDKSNLDLSTFSLGPISFGSYSFTPPGSAQHFSGGLDLRPDLNLIVKVDAGLNLSTGVVTWHFTSLDPDTEQLTTDPAAGFLPPDITPPQGEGRMLYTIHPKTGIVSGTTICNQASVVFDTNAAINTQNWCNTVDDTAPSSSVTRLPPTEANASFTVQWSGSDTGSGINDYNIYVSDNGAAFVPWLSNTTLTASTYAGTLGHSYAFYSIAQDLVGNTEASKSAADTSTLVSGATTPTCATDVTTQFSIVRGGYRYNNATKRFQQAVTITRTAAGSLSGPFAFAVRALDADATLYSPAGVTSCIVPGTSYLVLNPGATWISGQALSFTLDFVDPNKTGITYTPLILTGATR